MYGYFLLESTQTSISNNNQAECSNKQPRCIEVETFKEDRLSKFVGKFSFSWIEPEVKRVIFDEAVSLKDSHSWRLLPRMC